MLAGLYEGHPHLTFRAMDDLHRRGTLDRDWLVQFPDEPPHIVITKDDKLLRETSQLKAWIAGGLTVVIFGSEFGNVAQEEMAATLLRWWPTILMTVSAQPRRTAFTVPVAFRQIERLPLYTPYADKRKPRAAKVTEANQTNSTTKKRARRASSRVPEGQLHLPLISRRKARGIDGAASDVRAVAVASESGVPEGTQNSATPTPSAERGQSDRPDTP
jgi:hypothetical protein